MVVEVGSCLKNHLSAETASELSCGIRSEKSRQCGVECQEKIDAAVAEDFLDSSDSRNYRCAVILCVFPYCKD